jgi:hypothetical protein
MTKPYGGGHGFHVHHPWVSSIIKHETKGYNESKHTWIKVFTSTYG